jgi:hypothetical protein
MYSVSILLLFGSLRMVTTTYLVNSGQLLVPARSPCHIYRIATTLLTCTKRRRAKINLSRDRVCVVRVQTARYGRYVSMLWPSTTLKGERRDSYVSVRTTYQSCRPPGVSPETSRITRPYRRTARATNVPAEVQRRPQTQFGR